MAFEASETAIFVGPSVPKTHRHPIVFVWPALNEVFRQIDDDEGKIYLDGTKLARYAWKHNKNGSFKNNPPPLQEAQP